MNKRKRKKKKARNKVLSGTLNLPPFVRLNTTNQWHELMSQSDCLIPFLHIKSIRSV